ncbi:MAG TPA: hypothetical protein VL970_00220 [Candidatus Acidoferrales bacterium]|nr:hypothetical protein [Candidatus Acidoferrales bacterium]
MRVLTRHSQAHGQAAIASLLVGLFLLLNAMAASPALHEWLHHDAGQPGHQCGVTLFAHGLVDAAAGDVPMAAPMPSVEAVPSLVICVFSPAIEQLPAGRAPPVLPAAS